MSQQDLSGRLARWSLKLQGFQFQIEHRKGSLNVVPDALSRAFMDEVQLNYEAININLDSPAFGNNEYVQLVEKVRKNSSGFPNLRVEKGKLYIDPSNGKSETNTDISLWKLYIPKELISSLISMAHDPPSSSHLGVAKTLDRLQRFYYWPAMSKDVKYYVGNCEICKQIKAPNHSTQPLMGRQITAVRPMQHLYVDFLGPYPRSASGNSYLFIVLDSYSKFIFLKAMRQALATTVCSFLVKEIFAVFSVPETITSDNASQFNSVCFNNCLNKFGVNHMFVPKYSPQGNASERVNRSILAAIRAYIKDDHRKWDEHIHEIASALRNVTHSSTKFSPHYLMFGQHFIGHANDYKLLRELDLVANGEIGVQSKANRLSLAQQKVLSNLQDAHKRNENLYNLRSRNRDFHVGQTVYVRNFTLSNAVKNHSAKLAAKFLKATVLWKVGSVAYELAFDDKKSLGIYHAKDIRN